MEARSGTPISIRLDTDIRAALEREAKAAHRTLSGLIKHILREHVQQVEPQRGAVPR